MAHKPTAEPMDKSISPEIITRATPTATIPVMEACLSKIGTLRGDVNIQSVRNPNTIVTKPITMTNP